MSERIDELVRTLDADIPEAMRRCDVPGLAIGVCDVRRTLWCAAYGTTAKGGGSPVTPATSFSVQSTSKLVTATLVMLAVQDSLVDLDEPIVTYLPEFAVNSVFDVDPGRLITLRHLLGHTAGFTHEAPVGSNYDLSDDFEAHCRSIYRTWLRFPVGHHFEYSNLGIDLAGYVLQRVTGTPFHDYARRELLEPLGMGRSTFDAAAIAAETDRAIGHWRLFERAGRSLPVAVPMVAAGGLYTTVEDALCFVRLHLRRGEPLLSCALTAEQHRVPFPAEGQRLGYALGVYVDEWAPGVRVLHHGGSGFGFQSQLFWLPDQEVGAVILTNSFDHDLQNELARRIAMCVAGPAARRDDAEAPPADAFQAPEALDELVGEYVGRLETVRVTREDGRLVVRSSGTHAARLIGPRTIELDTPARDRYRFADGRDGAVRYMLALRDGQAHYRNDAARTPRSTLDSARAGTYTVRAWGVPVSRYVLEQRGDSPVIEQLGDDDEPAVALRLAPIEPDLYLSSTGEVLDLRSTPPTYANVALG